MVFVILQIFSEIMLLLFELYKPSDSQLQTRVLLQQPSANDTVSLVKD